MFSSQDVIRSQYCYCIVRFSVRGCLRINPQSGLGTRNGQICHQGRKIVFVVIMVKCGNILNYIEIISRQMRHTVPRIVFDQFDFLCILAEDSCGHIIAYHQLCVGCSFAFFKRGFCRHCSRVFANHPALFSARCRRQYEIIDATTSTQKMNWKIPSRSA